MSISLVIRDWLFDLCSRCGFLQGHFLWRCVYVRYSVVPGRNRWNDLLYASCAEKPPTYCERCSSSSCQFHILWAKLMSPCRLQNVRCFLDMQLATSKGYVAGALDFTEHDGNHVNCRDTSTVCLAVLACQGRSGYIHFWRFWVKTRHMLVELSSTYSSCIRSKICLYVTAFWVLALPYQKIN